MLIVLYYYPLIDMQPTNIFFLRGLPSSPTLHFIVAQYHDSPYVATFIGAGASVLVLSNVTAPNCKSDCNTG